jgi:hypothetical protein
LDGKTLEGIERKRVERFKLRDGIVELTGTAGTSGIRNEGGSLQKFGGGRAG